MNKLNHSLVQFFMLKMDVYVALETPRPPNTN